MDKQTTTGPREASKVQGKQARAQRKRVTAKRESPDGVDVQASPDTIVEGNQRQRRAEREEG